MDSHSAGVSKPNDGGAPRSNPELRTLFVADDAEGWAAAGFSLRHNGRERSVVIGTIRIVLEPDTSANGITHWAFGSSQITVTDGSIDGIRTVVTDDGPAEPIDAEHPNGASRIDHVVVTTPDLPRTLEALQNAGFAVRRSRDVPNSNKRQVFLWAGETILEVVGSVKQHDSSGRTDAAPATLWGLAITSNNLQDAAETLGSSLSKPKDAVQPGRLVATVATNQLDISVPMILMTSHISSNKAD